MLSQKPKGYLFSPAVYKHFLFAHTSMHIHAYIHCELYC